MRTSTQGGHGCRHTISLTDQVDHWRLSFMVIPDAAFTELNEACETAARIEKQVVMNHPTQTTGHRLVMAAFTL